MMTEQVAKALMETLVSPNESDQNLEPANVVDGLFAIARGLEAVARSIRDLGNGDAATPMGAIEGFAVIVRDACGDIASAIRETTE